MGRGAAIKGGVQAARHPSSPLRSWISSGGLPTLLAMEKPELRDAERRTQTLCLLVLAAVATGVALLHLRQVLVPFVLALFLTMAVTPVMDFLQRRFSLPRALAITTTIVLAFGVLVALATLVSAALADVVEKKDAYMIQVDSLVASGEERLRGMLAGVDGLLEEQPKGAEESSSALPDQTQESAAPVEGSLPSAETEEPDSFGREFRQLRGKFMSAAGGAIAWAVNSALSLMSSGLLVMVFMMFLIAGHRPLDKRDPDSLSYQLRMRVREYLRVKIAVSLLTGVSTYLILRVLGIDLALVFGLCAFFLNFIPNIGSAVAVILPFPVILLADPEEVSGLSKLLAVVLPMAVQFSVGSVIEPRWMGKSLDLNPIAILLSLIFWGVLWGPVGMLLSVPITAVLKMLLERSELTEPVAQLLADAD